MPEPRALPHSAVFSDEERPDRKESCKLSVKPPQTLIQSLLIGRGSRPILRD